MYYYPVSIFCVSAILFSPKAWSIAQIETTLKKNGNIFVRYKKKNNMVTVNE